MKEHPRTEFDAAVKAKDAGDLPGSRQMLVRLHQTDPHSAAILAVLGHVCWESNLLEEAIESFRKATILKPQADAVSLGLFHCLFKVGRTDEAFDEMRRFLSEYDSEEYTRLLAELKGG